MAQRICNIIVCPAPQIIEALDLYQSSITAHDCVMIVFGEPRYFPLALDFAKLSGFLFCGDLCSDILSPAIWDISTDAFDTIKRSSCLIFKRGNPRGMAAAVSHAAIEKVFGGEFYLSCQELAQIEGPISRYLQEVFPDAQAH